MKKLGIGDGASPRLQIRLPKNLYEVLLTLAARDRRSLPDYVRLALEDFVAKKRKNT
jgi:predicted DNA-binding protein